MSVCYAVTFCAGPCLHPLQSVPRGMVCPGCTRWINPTPDPARTAAGLRRARGLPDALAELSPGARASLGTGHTAVTWRRAAWQVLGQYARSIGRPFALVEVLDAVGPAPHLQALDVLESHAQTAVSRLLLRRLQDGTYEHRTAPATPVVDPFTGQAS